MRHPGRWISGGLVILLLAVIGRAFAVGQIQWTVVGEFLTAGVIVTGFGWTLLISACALVLGVLLGFAFGIMRLSENPILRFAAWLYVWVFRGTPVLLQLLIWFNIALVFPRLYIPGLVDARMVDVVTPLVAAVLGLGVNEGSYHPQPSRRTYIPKADGRQRPLAIAALEDKIVQGATVMVLNAIYEGDFCGFSYGFRPGRGPHDAMDALCTAIGKRKVNWIIDADIQNFFGAVSQSWLVRFLEHRIGDKRITRLIQKWLKAGILEDGVVTVDDKGTGQGSVISPLLGNI